MYLFSKPYRRCSTWPYAVKCRMIWIVNYLSHFILFLFGSTTITQQSSLSQFLASWKAENVIANNQPAPYAQTVWRLKHVAMFTKCYQKAEDMLTMHTHDETRTPDAYIKHRTISFLDWIMRLAASICFVLSFFWSWGHFSFEIDWF